MSLLYSENRHTSCIAMKKNTVPETTTLSYLLGDHPSTSLCEASLWDRASIGSSSVTTDASGGKTASALYREAPCKGSSGNLNTDHKFCEASFRTPVSAKKPVVV
jgi:hypothetical protein